MNDPDKKNDKKNYKSTFNVYDSDQRTEFCNISMIDLFNESEKIARRATIRWGINQTGGIPMPSIDKKIPLLSRFHIFK